MSYIPIGNFHDQLLQIGYDAKRTNQFNVFIWRIISQLYNWIENSVSVVRGPIFDYYKTDQPFNWPLQNKSGIHRHEKSLHFPTRFDMHLLSINRPAFDPLDPDLQDNIIKLYKDNLGTQYVAQINIYALKTHVSAPDHTSNARIFVIACDTPYIDNRNKFRLFEIDRYFPKESIDGLPYFQLEFLVHIKHDRYEMDILSGSTFIQREWGWLICVYIIEKTTELMIWNDKPLALQEILDDLTLKVNRYDNDLQLAIRREIATTLVGMPGNLMPTVKHLPEWLKADLPLSTIGQPANAELEKLSPGERLYWKHWLDPENNPLPDIEITGVKQDDDTFIYSWQYIDPQNNIIKLKPDGPSKKVSGWELAHNILSISGDVVSFGGKAIKAILGVIVGGGGGGLAGIVGGLVGGYDAGAAAGAEVGAMGGAAAAGIQVSRELYDQYHKVTDKQIADINARLDALEKDDTIDHGTVHTSGEGDVDLTGPEHDHYAVSHKKKNDPLRKSAYEKDIPETLKQLGDLMPGNDPRTFLKDWPATMRDLFSDIFEHQVVISRKLKMSYLTQGHSNDKTLGLIRDIYTAMRDLNSRIIKIDEEIELLYDYAVSHSRQLMDLPVASNVKPLMTSFTVNSLRY